MNTTIRCDGCNKRFRNPDDAVMFGIQGEDEPELIYHVCAKCFLALSENDRLEAEATERAKRHQTQGVLAA